MSKQDLVRLREIRVGDALDDQRTAAQIQSANTASVTQEDYQQFLLSQVKRMIHGDRPGHWYDDFDGDITSLQDLAYDFLLDCDPAGGNITHIPTYNGIQFADETWKFTPSGVLIKRCTYAYNGLYAQTAVCQVFDKTGATIAAQTTTTYNWSGGRLVSTSLTRDI